VQHYLKLRQFERFYQSLGSSSILAYSADYDVFKVAPANINDGGIHIFSCAKSLIHHFAHIKKTKQSTLNVCNVGNSKITFIQTDSLETVSESSLAYPIATTLDGLEYHSVSNSTKQSESLQLLKTLQSRQFDSTLKFNQSLNSILTMLTLKNIKLQ